MGGTNHFLTEVIPQVHPLEAPKTNIENVENRPLEKEIHFVGKHWLGYRSMILIYIYIMIYVYILYRLERQRERERRTFKWFVCAGAHHSKRNFPKKDTAGFAGFTRFMSS